ncbi:tRNA 4-thiouridine(8) synthase ThiI [Desulfosoma sp.]
MRRRGKGIGLLSGGLDSILAVKVLQEQPLELLGITFFTPFFGPEPGLKAGRMTGIPTRAVDIGPVFLEMLKNPPHGYGRHMNPCIDCHGLMLREAAGILAAEGADFLFTGEVVGQRPMSQRRAAMKIVEKMSGLSGRILRPLSAKLLEPTVVELEGIVEREKLLDLHGRGRKRQMELAARYGIRDFPQPGGGCMLTKEGFARKVKELLAMLPEADTGDVEWLKWGRHFRLGASCLLTVGRSKSENERLSAMARPGDVVLRVPSHPGPTGILFGKAKRRAHVHMASMIVAAYSDVALGERVEVHWRQGAEQGRIPVKNVGKEPWATRLL